MRKKLPAFLSLLLLVLGAAHAACPPSVEIPDSEELQAAVSSAIDRGFLWRLRRDGHESYLYGTLHIGRLAWAMPGPKLRVALRTTDTLAVEVDVSDPQTMSLLTKAPPLDPPLSAALQQRLDVQVRAACLPDETLSGLHPLLQVSTLEALAGRWDDMHLEFGQDVVLLGMAHSDGRAVVALETVEEQLAALIPNDAREIEPTIEKSLAQLERNEIIPMLRKTAAAWSESDIVTLERYEDWCNCVGDEQERSYMDNLVKARNRTMAGRFAALHADGHKVFAAVGALHMVGPDGLPSLLQAMGFEVQRLVPAE
jgi:uncharacterized protein YbaP (TraB family)